MIISKSMEPIKEIWTSSYTLTEQRSQKDRIGLLIKVLFSTDKVGYKQYSASFSF